ncbi:MAG: alpha-2-macroglobulin family protein [Kofleriaceae bacterium]
MTTLPKTASVNTGAAIAAGTAATGRPQVHIDTAAIGAELTVRSLDGKTAPARVEVTALSDAETRALQARMEPLPAVDNAKAPTMRAPTAPPPSTSPAQPIAFVVPTGKAVSDAPIAPSKVTVPLAPPEISPQGSVRAESEIRVRFDEPMVRVASVGTETQVPATIAPAITGTWRWIDTRVAVFTSAPRLPQATVVTVTVAAGTKALSGAALAADVKATFDTPPIALDGAYPRGAVRPDSAIVVKLDQDFDADKVAAFVRVTNTKGNVTYPHQVITLAEAEQRWAKNPSIAFDSAKQTDLLGKRYLVIAPKTAWPAGAELRIGLKVGAPSREGPRLSTRESFAGFQVAPAFTVRGLTCEDMEKPQAYGAKCPARSYVRVDFSNEIAVPTYRADKTQIDGQAFEDNKPYGNNVLLTAPELAGRGYTVSVGEGIVDIYGQPLIGGRKLGFVTTAERFASSIEVPTGMHVLDPRFEIPQWVVVSEAVASLRIQLYQVQPKDYFAFQQYEEGKRGVPPGKRVYDKTHQVGAQHGVNVRVDLRPALNQAGFGHVVAIATATPGRPNQREDRRTAWMQVTRLGVSSRIDGEHVNAWVQDITPNGKFLAPISGINTFLLVEDRGEGTAVASDAQGHVALDLMAAVARKPGDPERTSLLVAQSGTDSTFAVIGLHEKTQRVNDALWYVTDDRFIYKPGEKVYLKGWVRWTHNGPNPDIALPAAADSVAYTLRSSNGTKITSGTAQFTPQGGFHLEADLPQNVNLGTAYFTFSTRTDSYRHPISIQEFRTPAYSVALNDDVGFSGAAPVILGESIEMLATAKYYSGGNLPGAAVQWDATLTTTTYRPPGWERFTFDPPYKRSANRYYYSSRYGYDHEGSSIQLGERGTLSGASTATVVYGITALAQNLPSVLSVDTTVTDVDRMSIRASSRSILIHPSTYYVGLRLKGDTTDVLEAVVSDLDGNAVANVPIRIDIEGVLGSERFRDDAKVVDTQSCVITSAATPATCPFKRKNIEWSYSARAHVADPRGRTNDAQLQIPWWATDRTRDFTVTPDKASYRPGDIAKIEIQSKVLPATAVVTFARQGMISQKRIDLTQPSTRLDVPIDVSQIQNVFVIVDRYAKRQAVRKGSTLPLPEDDSIEVNLPVDIEGARLAMKTRSTRKIVEPGSDATFEVEVKHGDAPVAGAEVALMVVDEAVLALSGRSHADPLAPFYRHVQDGTQAYSSLPTVYDSGEDLAGKPGVERFELGKYGTIGHGSGTGSGYGVGGGAGGMAGSSTSVVTARKDFRANAVFSPVLETDANGKVSVTVKMPDQLTRFRIVALATSKTHYFGKAESTIVTQRKVNARTVAPRFLTQGDGFAVPIVVQNLDSAARTVDLAVRAANLDGVGPAGKRVVIPGGQRVEIRFEFKTKARGKAVIQTIATSGEFADASNVELPVYEPATTESFATYGTVDDAPRFEQLAVPKSIFADVGGVEVELASTQLQSLTDAYWYLYAYPYECAEQRSGRMLASAALYDILDAFATQGRPTKTEIDAQRAKDAVVLGREQKPDGGWGYFSGTKSDPFVTMQVLQALTAQKITGKVTTTATTFVARQQAALFAQLEKAVATPQVSRTTDQSLVYTVSLAAASLTALATSSDVRPRAERLHVLATTLAAYPVDAKARLLAIVAKLDRAKPMRTKLLSDLISATHETASAATVTAQFVEAERLLLVSNTKTSALALDAIMREAPDHAVITKLARGVLDARKHGRWMSTQENLVALQAMRRYFDTYEKVTPNYTGKLWFGQAAYAEQSFAGRTRSPAVVRSDWATLVPGSTHDLAIVKQGPGRMYYRVGIVYAPTQTNLPPLDAGFIVRRTYTAAEDPSDVVKTAAGYRIKLGAKVVVTLEAVNSSQRHAVALVDPLPAGLEPVNENLATAERAVRVTSDDGWDHVNMRDNRVEAFRMDLAAGAHRYSYTARATTPGTFIAAPTKAEEMYSPETFGRSPGSTVVIE